MHPRDKISPLSLIIRLVDHSLSLEEEVVVLSYPRNLNSKQMPPHVPISEELVLVGILLLINTINYYPALWPRQKKTINYRDELVGMHILKWRSTDIWGLPLRSSFERVRVEDSKLNLIIRWASRTVDKEFEQKNKNFQKRWFIPNDHASVP